ncbi:ATP phosphoribosyltransferase [Actinomycetaceae bacterium MB13-C1-2]|nr:ATP phosphoribosyltransferase [Actinomycetaceae bacterium MB13-C1-2]
MLRIAVPNKGSLSEASVDLLAEAGYRTKRRGRELVIVDPRGDTEVFFLRPRDIAVYVAEGRVHAGITGRDLVADSPSGAIELMGLGFGRSLFRFAAPVGLASRVEDLEGKRVATSYDKLVRDYLSGRGVEAQVIHLDGAVESSIQLGVADAIADVVETGSTLKAAGLEVFADPIMESEAILITGQQHEGEPQLSVLVNRIQGVLVARDHVLVDYNIELDNLSKATLIAPGLESPTVSPLAEQNWRAVRVVVARNAMNQVMDELLTVGAKGIIVTELAASRLG